MLHIDEQALNILLTSHSVAGFELREGEGGYGVYLWVGAKGEQGMLISARTKHQAEKTPRKWASVDTFIRYLKTKVETPPDVKIHFVKKGGRKKKTMQHAQ
jgi:hypothetical protein